MVLSANQAAELLHAAVGISVRSAREVLATGLAGPPTRLRGMHLYPADTVQRLALRRPVRRDALTSLTGGELLVLRLGSGSGFRVSAPVEVREAAVQRHFRPSPLLRVHLRRRIAEHGALPMIATVGGFVVLGADVTDLHPSPDGGSPPPSLMRMAGPGDWFAGFEERWFGTGPGGPWRLWKVGGPQVSRLQQ